jgi:integrase
MVQLAGYRGFRFGEAAGLRPKRIDLLRGRVEIAEALKEVSGRHYFRLPKHKRIRQMALPVFLIESLRLHMEAFPPQNDLLFTNPGGTLLRRSNYDRRVWQPAVRRAGLDERLTFHGLRHTAVSILIAEGASIVELASIPGWSHSTAVAMSMRYGHLFTAREQHLTEALDRLYRSAGRPGDGLDPAVPPERQKETGP